MPVKIARMWWGDDYLDTNLKEETAFYATNPTFQDKLKRIFSGALFSLSYYIIIISFFLCILKFWKTMDRNLYVLLLPVLLGTMMHALMYGMQRYHVPYMPIVIIFAAWWIYSALIPKMGNKMNIA